MFVSFFRSSSPSFCSLSLSTRLVVVVVVAVVAAVLFLLRSFKWRDKREKERKRERGKERERKRGRVSSVSSLASRRPIARLKLASFFLDRSLLCRSLSVAAVFTFSLTLWCVISTPNPTPPSTRLLEGGKEEEEEEEIEEIKEEVDEILIEVDQSNNWLDAIDSIDLLAEHLASVEHLGSISVGDFP